MQLVQYKTLLSIIIMFLISAKKMVLKYERALLFIFLCTIFTLRCTSPNKQSNTHVYPAQTWDRSMKEHNTYFAVDSFLIFFCFLNSFNRLSEKMYRN